jgi:MSHA biogenesis protein MshO
LVELVIVIVMLGIIGAIVAVFIRAPIQAYFDGGRRAALTDVADTAVRRISRDIRKALPNSVRVSTSGTDSCLEFIPTRNGARYRESNRPTGDSVGKGLNFSAPDSTFNMLGRNADWPADQQIRTDDLAVVYNLGITGADAYAGDNVARIASVATDTTSGAVETTLTLAAAKQFPLESGTKRFHIVPVEENVVAYVCSGSTLRRLVTPGLSTGTAPLFTNSATRYCGSAGNPVSAAPILVSDVSSCSFTYNDSDAQRNGLVQMTLSITRNAETVNLYHQIQVNNTP